jgi:hypothetical protein
VHSLHFQLGEVNERNTAKRSLTYCIKAARKALFCLTNFNIKKPFKWIAVKAAIIFYANHCFGADL